MSFLNLWRRPASPAPSSSRNNSSGYYLNHHLSLDGPETSPTRPAATANVWEQREPQQQQNPVDEQRDDDGSVGADENDIAATITIPLRQVPLTPEGLRSRPSAATLRREVLGVRQHYVEPELPQPQREPPPQALSSSEAMATGPSLPPSRKQQRPFLVEKKPAPNNMLLPPAPSASWSLPKTNPSAPPQQHPLLYSASILPFQSPQVSLNGFYDDNDEVEDEHANRSHRVAESPYLVPGRAKTAVGALVAKQQHQQQQQKKVGQPPASNQHLPPLLAASSSASTTGYEADAQTRDPRDVIYEESNLNSGNAQNNSYRHSTQAPQQRILPASASQDQSEGIDSKYRIAYEDDKPYYPLDKDPIQQSRTPVKQPRQQTQAQQQLKFHISPMTANSSFVQASPSSLARKAMDHSFATNTSAGGESHSIAGDRFVEETPYYLREDAQKKKVGGDGKRRDEEDDSSRAGLIRSAEQQRKRDAKGVTPYDFASVHDTSFNRNHVTEVVLQDPSDQTHVSAMSFSLPDNNTTVGPVSYGELASSVAEEDYDECEGDEDGMDDTLVSQKAKNQRKSREDLLVAAVERLQDDLELIRQVETVVAQEMSEQQNQPGKEDWFVQTDMEKEGFLTGFSLENRRRLSDRLGDILEEMNGAAAPEDFFVMSPTEIPQYVETHSDLYQALQFCRSLVQMAIPASEQEAQTASAMMVVQNGLGQGKWQLDSSLKQTMNLGKAADIAAAASPVFAANRRRSYFGGDTSVFTLPSESADTPMTSNLSVASTANKKKWVDTEGAKVQRTIEMIATLLERLGRACRQWLDSASIPLPAQQSVQITRDIKRCYLQLVGLRHDDLAELVHAFDLVQKTTPSMDEFMPCIALISTDEDEQHMEEQRSVEAPHDTDVAETNATFSPSKKSRMPELDDLRRQIGSHDEADQLDEERDPPPA